MFNPTANTVNFNPYAAPVPVPDNWGETINPYRWLLEGRGAQNGRTALPGRYGEVHLLQADFSGRCWPKQQFLSRPCRLSKPTQSQWLST